MTKKELPQISDAALAALGLPMFCYVEHPSLKVPVIVKRGEMGFTMAQDIGDATAEDLNRKAGITKAQAEAMLTGSLFGFNVPGANPAVYE